jgi:hypothetical protein
MRPGDDGGPVVVVPAFLPPDYAPPPLPPWVGEQPTTSTAASINPPAPKNAPIQEPVAAPKIRYYTYRDDVPLRPGQVLDFTAGKGYYARTVPINGVTPTTTQSTPTAPSPNAAKPVRPGPADADVRYHTHRDDVPVGPGQTLGFTTGRGYYARNGNTKPPAAPTQRYYTFKDDVPLEPGQVLGFTRGKGYYARAGGNTARELPSAPTLSPMPVLPDWSDAFRSVIRPLLGSQVPRNHQDIRSALVAMSQPQRKPPSPSIPEPAPSIVTTETKTFQHLDIGLRLFPFPYRFRMSFTFGSRGLIGYDASWDTSALTFPDSDFSVVVTVTFTNMKGAKRTLFFGALQGGAIWPGHLAFGGQGYWAWSADSPITNFDIRLVQIVSRDMGSGVLGVDHIRGAVPLPSSRGPVKPPTKAEIAASVRAT